MEVGGWSTSYQKNKSKIVIDRNSNRNRTDFYTRLHGGSGDSNIIQKSGGPYREIAQVARIL